MLFFNLISEIYFMEVSYKNNISVTVQLDKKVINALTLQSTLMLGGSPQVTCI